MGEVEDKEEKDVEVVEYTPIAVEEDPLTNIKNQQDNSSHINQGGNK